MSNDSGKGGQVKVTANVNITLIGPDGRIKRKELIKNLVVTAGLVEVVKQILGSAVGGAQPAKFNYAAVGTGSVAPTIGDIALGAEIGTRQQDVDPEFPVAGQGKLDVTFGPGNGTGLISESGVFNSLASTVLLARTTFTAIDKQVGDSLQIAWTFTLS